ncbi:MAG: PQQ-binding-like beta-propeller repeat protein [Proteobacteria bacterium]|nr:PQQ-binding-like beta-propeller repeat protein [Pseudomonadota bacterium]MBU4296930.1 PQQ-binding-like beta-propeller repeat protein [Pseudomonadota bacterium]
MGSCRPINSYYEDGLHAINPDGTKKWAFNTDLSIYASPAINTDGTIYVGTKYGSDKLYAINPNGTLKWAVGLLRGYGLILSHWRRRNHLFCGLG